MNLGNVLIFSTRRSTASPQRRGGRDHFRRIDSPGAIALDDVVVGYLFVEAGWPLPAGRSRGSCRRCRGRPASSWLVVRVVAAFIATLGVMGILRGTVHRDRSAVLRSSAKRHCGLARGWRIDRLAGPS